MKQAENELLCRIGPGTPMGAVFRRYWNPVAMSDQAPHADAAPLRLEILGERLVLFRDSAGELGLLEEGCLHRGASLALGRVEKGGIRCIYHGWKFDRDGKLLEVPTHRDQRVRERLQATAYPVREAGGFVWAYMGPPEREPPFPHWRFFDLPLDHVRRIRLYANVNYLQQLEGGTDSSHVGILHSNFARPSWTTGEFRANDDPDNPATLATGDLAPELVLEDTDFGFHYAAFRELPPGASAPDEHNVRVVPVIMPSTRIIPAPAIQFLIFEVPVNDTRTATFAATYRLDGAAVDVDKLNEYSGRHDKRLLCPDTFEYLGTWDNRFGQNRDAMQSDWSGIKGISMEDMAIALSQGPIVDRTRETLLPSDRAVVRTRTQLLAAARVVAEGGDPVGVRADVHPLVAVDSNQSRGSRWQQLVPAHQARATSDEPHASAA